VTICPPLYLPHPQVCIYSGLLEIIERDEDAIAFVLGHEMGHCLLRHTSETHTFSDIFIMPLLEVLEVVTGVQFQAGIVSNMLFYWLDRFPSMAYSQMHEYEADMLGAYFSAAACFNPRKGSDRLFQAFQARWNASTVGAHNEYMRSHPTGGKRLAQLQAVMNSTDFREKEGLCLVSKLCEMESLIQSYVSLPGWEICGTMHSLVYHPFLQRTELNVSDFVCFVASVQMCCALVGVTALLSRLYRRMFLATDLLRDAVMIEPRYGTPATQKSGGKSSMELLEDVLSSRRDGDTLRVEIIDIQECNERASAWTARPSVVTWNSSGRAPRFMYNVRHHLKGESS